MSLQEAYKNVKNGNATIQELISVICGRNKEVCMESAYELSQFRENRLTSNGFTINEARKIRAAFQLIDLAEVDSDKPEYINCSRDALPWLKSIAFQSQEHFAVIALDQLNGVLDVETVHIGSVGSSIVHPRDVLRFAIQNGATSIIISHCHPSFTCKPSPEDVSVTERLAKACKIVNITLVDHIIVGGDTYLSMKEKGYY